MQVVANLRTVFYTGMLFCISPVAMAQHFPKKNGPGGAAPGYMPANQAPATKSGPRPYREVVGKAKTQKGLFLVHKLDDRYLYEIPDSLFNRDFLVITRVARAGVAAREEKSMEGFAGDEVNSNVISFEKGPNNKVFLLKKSFSEISADSTKEMYLSVLRSNMQPIVASFDVKAAASDSNGIVIDLTDYVSGDNDILHFNGRYKSAWKIGGFQPDKSYITDIRSFPLNMNIRAVKTYTRAGGQAAGYITLELTTSFIALPMVPMKPRYADPRIGYFTISHTDFDQNPQGVKKIEMIERWRLEPKPADIERYKKGELVEPAKSIVIYIDPATPAKWIPYLIQGVNDWQGAFEKAGFKNAIIGKKAPTSEEDSTWSMDDARHSVIVYKPSAVSNASGPVTTDPRSGEILETHINWYHNIMELLRKLYLVQAGATDPRARKIQFGDELMGQLIRFVSSHEVGHTLGLRHNFGSSSTVPVENLRNKQWVEEYGHTPSIMDYARFNYVAQPEDNIAPKGIFPRIGDYDNWAIEWGYKWLNKPVEEETAMLSRLTTEKAGNNRLWFGSEYEIDDPRSQSEDLGDNAMLAGDYGIKNLRRILPELVTWTTQPAEGYDDLSMMYSQVLGQFGRYIGHVLRNIGGGLYNPKTAEQTGPVFEYVSRARQKEAMVWLNKNVLITPAWILNKEIKKRINFNSLNSIQSLQDKVLAHCLSSVTFDKLTRAEADMASAAYTVTELLTDLQNMIFTELRTKKTIDIYRRNLQRNYVNKIERLLMPQSAAKPSNGQGEPGATVSMGYTGDWYPILKDNIKQLRKEIKGAIPLIRDKKSRHHLEILEEWINYLLNDQPR